MINNKTSAVRGIPTNTFHIEGKSGTGKAIYPEGIIDKLQEIATLAFLCGIPKKEN